jgi:hypothetical protein
MGQNKTDKLGSRTGRYFKYAIGEIVLVVIGILIALQINTWNSKRIQKQKEVVYLTNIKRDLHEQLKTIEDQIIYERTINEVATPIIRHYKAHQAFNIDSIFTSHIGILSGRKTFVKNTPTYSELISSGNLDIIGNDILKDDIIKYYQELERTELIINKNNNLFTDAVFIPEALRLSEIQIRGEFSLDVLNKYDKDKHISLVDLNEPRLKAITKSQLEKPENELVFINNINFRNFLSIIHMEILDNQKGLTETLLNKL